MYLLLKEYKHNVEYEWREWVPEFRENDFSSPNSV
jgi:hypothetical protein